MQFGKALKLGNKGDRIAVRLDNGKTINAIAGNEINSDRVVFISGLVFSASSPTIERQETSISKTGTGEDAIACQLVAASLVQAEVLLEDINNNPNIPEHQISPHIEKVLRPASETFNYNSGLKLCLAQLDGGGEYENEAACLVNRSSATDIAMETLNSDLSESNSFGFPASILNDRYTKRIGKLEIEPNYAIASNGDLVVVQNGEAGYHEGNNFKIILRIAKNTDPLATPATWFDGNFVDTTNPLDTGTNYKFELFDGSIIFPFGYTLTEDNNYYYLTSEILSFSQLQSLEDNYYSLAYNFPPDLINSNLTVASAVATLVFRLTAYRDVGVRYISYIRLNSWFVKFHDPDLPLLKILTLPDTPIPFEPYFIYLGDRAYFICKIGKQRQPEITVSERSWYQVKVIELSIDDNNILVAIETDYFAGDTIISDNENYLSPLTDTLDVEPTNNDCIDNEEFIPSFRRRFIELNYQGSPNKKGIIVHKVPGDLLFAPGE